ncbi:hypothetical protein [Streptomyces sp. NPDC088746]|uniref:hypothetical protein n=1 Tax=Streptomyces sp. NPDC088746 TaxID=3365885 RepID=UPI00380668FA
MYPTLFTTPGVKAFAEQIDEERQAQLRKFGEQHHPDGTSNDPTSRLLRDSARVLCDFAAKRGEVTWRHILDEEVREVIAETDPVALRTELLQVAAVCAAWIHDLDSRGTVTAPPEGEAAKEAQSGPFPQQEWQKTPCPRCKGKHPRHCPDCPNDPPCADHVCSWPIDEAQQPTDGRNLTARWDEAAGKPTPLCRCGFVPIACDADRAPCAPPEQPAPAVTEETKAEAQRTRPTPFECKPGNQCNACAVCWS